MRPSHRGYWVSVCLAVVLVAGSAEAAEQFRVADRSVAALRAPVGVGGKVKVDRLPIDGREATLELERFEVWAPGAEIKVYGDNEEVLDVLAPPATRYFRGHVSGDSQSLVFLAVDGDKVDGIVWTADKRFAVGSRSWKGAVDVFVEEASVLDETPIDGHQGFVCEVEGKQLRQGGRPRAISHGADATPAEEGVLATGTARWLLNIAVDTDYELYTRAGNSSANVTTYIGNLVAAASTIYRRDLLTELRVSYLGIQSSAADPFTVVPGAAGTWNGASVTHTTMHALLELGDRWHNAAPSTAPRSSTILISGKSQSSGIAWVEVLCDPDFSYGGGHWGGRYAYCGGIMPPANLAVPNPDANPGYQSPASNYWPLLQFTHELGHNVGSDHTHCISLSPADQSSYGRAYVDQCYAGQSGCYTGGTTIPAERGTIMSYCHLSGGTNTRFTFGQNGEASYVIPPAMRADIQTATPTMSAITAPSALAAGASGAASVTHSAGIGYSWSIQNGTINGATTGAGINFTATAHPVTLTVTATNSVGCAVTDSINVNVTQSCTFGINPAARSLGSPAGSGTVAVTTACAWTATSNAAWITITGGSSGTGNGTVSYSVSQNLTGAPRNGTMTIAGQTFTVTQTSSRASAHTDFDGDGYADLFWRSQSAGQNAVWLMNAANVANSGYVTTLDSNWSVKGIGDFDGNGRADVLWRNAASLHTVIWFMNGTTVASGAYIPTASAEWSISGVGDFNADGRADILWRNSVTSEAVVWLMNGAAIQSSASVASPASFWVIDGVGDFNGNGRADILWRNTNTSESVVWLMNGAAIESASYLATPSAVWSVKGVGDFNGDGMADIAWRNSSTYETVVWLMNGLSLLTAGWAPTVSAQWNLQAVADYDADGKADMVWRNSANGSNAMWFMNGTNVSSSTLFLAIPETAYNIVGPK